MLDRGVIDEEIAEQRILPFLPERLHSAARGLIEKWDDPIVPVEGILELLQALKAKGYRLYADLYDSASFEAKKMIVSQLIRRVDVYRGYQIHVDFNFDLAQYLENSDELAC